MLQRQWISDIIKSISALFTNFICEDETKKSRAFSELCVSAILGGRKTAAGKCVKDVILTYKTWNKLTSQKVMLSVYARWGKSIYRIVHGMLMIFIHRHMRLPPTHAKFEISSQHITCPHRERVSVWEQESGSLNCVWCQTILHAQLSCFVVAWSKKRFDPRKCTFHIRLHSIGERNAI